MCLRQIIGEHCYHITHRCHQRQFLLRWQKDRRSFRCRLWQMSQKYPVSILNYMLTGNHIHLVLWAEQPAAVSLAMQFLDGTTSHDYNRRCNREGAFWSRRYRPTIVQSDTHLARCFFYVEMNMVRARAIKHPGQWLGGAYDEFTGQRQRYRIIDMEKLLALINHPCVAAFRKWYLDEVARQCKNEQMLREPWWSEAAAVGSQSWTIQVSQLLQGYEQRNEPVAASADTYGLWLSNRLRESFLAVLTRFAA